MVYGYARVSTHGQAKDGNSLEAQEQELLNAGAQKIYFDAFTGKVTERPELDKLVSELKNGDTFIVTKLDRIARSVKQGIELIDSLLEKGVKVNVLAMGMMDSSPTGKLIRNVMLSFAEFERELIIQRTMEGKQIARRNPGYREGRPEKYSRPQREHALELLESHSYSQVVDMTGISRATLVRIKAKKRKMKVDN